jgi:hypothetical protein
MDKEIEGVRCLLCEGSIPADDLKTRVEHMKNQHGADTEDQAKNMATSYFSRIYEGPEIGKNM